MYNSVEHQACDLHMSGVMVGVWPNVQVSKRPISLYKNMYRHLIEASHHKVLTVLIFYVQARTEPSLDIEDNTAVYAFRPSMITVGIWQAEP